MGQRAGGNDAEDIFDIVTDNDGNIFLVGNFKGSAICDAGGIPVNLNSDGGGENQDGFIAKYPGDGVLAWVESYGFSQGSDGLSNIELDTLGNIYVGGFKYVV